MLLLVLTADANSSQIKSIGPDFRPAHINNRVLLASRSQGLTALMT